MSHQSNSNQCFDVEWIIIFGSIGTHSIQIFRRDYDNWEGKSVT
uniref:Uncharacterized protein n=1 Tax=Rhizophora mucronata TaxID=61149 RepID=A0A2P2IIZ1_RHIMU